LDSFTAFDFVGLSLFQIAFNLPLNRRALASTSLAAPRRISGDPQSRA